MSGIAYSRARKARRFCAALAVALLSSLFPAVSASASECSAQPGAATGAPEPYQAGDPACVPDGLEDASPPEKAARASAGEVDHHYTLGATRLGGHGSPSYDAFYAALNVVDPAVEHPSWGSDAHFKEKIGVHSCNFGDLRLLEVGWMEFSWTPGYTQQYLYVRKVGGSALGRDYTILTDPALVHQPGERVYVELLSLGNGIWGAYANSNRTAGWLQLATFDLGTDRSCWVNQSVEMYSAGKDFMFDPVQFGNGAPDGVMLRTNPSDPFQSWGSYPPSQEYSEDGNGGYYVEWRQKYYDWYVKSRNAGPQATLWVTPSEGDLTTQFQASLESSRDPNGDEITHLIDWGDGTVTSGVRSTHQYSAPGTYTVVGTVTETRTGRIGQDEQRVEVCAVAPNGECAASPPRPPDSPDLCVDAGVCNAPEKPSLPVSLAPTRAAVRSLPRTPKGEVLVVNANVLQAYARASNPKHNENCASGSKTCRSAAREDAFAGRVRKLGLKARGPLDGMGLAPDVLLLQEAIHEDAAAIASRLRDITPFNYRVAVAEVDPEVDKRDNDGDGKTDTVTKSDTAIIYNKTTMLKTGQNWVTTTYDRDTEGCPGGPQGDVDLDGLDDCEYTKWKKNFTAEFVERKAGTNTALRGGHRVAVATIHYVTASHLKPGIHETKTTTWSNQVADDLQDDFPAADSYLVGGDFNIERCADSVDPPGVHERRACATRAWWRTMTDEGTTGHGFEDTVFAKHGGNDATLSAQYRDGCDEIDREGRCDPHFREKRIDMIFSKGPTVVAASHDLTCGMTATNLREAGRLPNCDDLLNDERYSDHRIVWTLIEN